MTASQKPKTPSMTMKVKDGVSEADIKTFCKRASRVTLAQLVEGVVVNEQLRVEGQARRTQFTVDLNFFPKEEILEEHDVDPLDILSVFATKFPLLLKKELQNELKKLDADLKSQIAELGKGKAVRTREGTVGDDDEGDSGKRGKEEDAESEGGDGDADEEKRLRQKKEQTSYESDEDEDADEEVEAFNDDEVEAALASDSEDEAEKPKPRLTKKQANFKQQVSRTSDLFQGHLPQAVSFNFDEKKCTFQVEVRR